MYNIHGDNMSHITFFQKFNVEWPQAGSSPRAQWQGTHTYGLPVKRNVLQPKNNKKRELGPDPRDEPPPQSTPRQEPDPEGTPRPAPAGAPETP